MVECRPAIVLREVANFWAKISALDSWQPFPGFSVTDLNHERLHTVVVLIDEASSKDDCVARETTEITWPVLVCSDGRRVDDPFILGLVQSRSGLKTSYI